MFQCRCGEVIELRNPKSRLWQNQTDTEFVILIFFFFYEANKTTSYVWVLLKKTKAKQKQKQNDAFYDRFSDSQGYKFIFFSQNLLTFSLTLASRVSLDIAPRLSSRRRYASPKLSPSLTDHSKTTVSFFVFSVLFVFVFYCFFLFICLGKLKA